MGLWQTSADGKSGALKIIYHEAAETVRIVDYVAQAPGATSVAGELGFDQTTGIYTVGDESRLIFNCPCCKAKILRRWLSCLLARPNLSSRVRLQCPQRPR